jgi:RNA polymerase sigma-70 factor (ECF subfamily)
LVLPHRFSKNNASAAPADEGRPDGEIIRDCQRGDRAAFAELVGRYSSRAWSVAASLLNDDEEAKDVVQDAFLRVYRALERFDFSQHFYTWLYRIVVNLAIDRLRRIQKLKPVAIDDVAEPESHERLELAPGRRLEAGETRDHVHAVLECLPDKYRTVMVLRELNGLSCKEIARIVSSSHATVRWRLHVARKMFKDAWERRENRAARGEFHHEM